MTTSERINQLIFLNNWDGIECTLFLLSVLTHKVELHSILSPSTYNSFNSSEVAFYKIFFITIYFKKIMRTLAHSSRSSFVRSNTDVGSLVPQITLNDPLCLRIRRGFDMWYLINRETAIVMQGF